MTFHQPFTGWAGSVSSLELFCSPTISSKRLSSYQSFYVTETNRFPSFHQRVPPGQPHHPASCLSHLTPWTSSRSSTCGPACDCWLPSEYPRPLGTPTSPASAPALFRLVWQRRGDRAADLKRHSQECGLFYCQLNMLYATCE